MNEQNTVQELKSERVQGPESKQAKKRLPRPDETIRAEVLPAPGRAQQRLKSERVQSRLKQMPGWQMQTGEKAIDRVRKFPDPLVAASYLAFAALLARQSGQPLRASVVGSTIVLALPGRSRRPGEGLTEDVMDLAEQLG